MKIPVPGSVLRQHLTHIFSYKTISAWSAGIALSASSLLVCYTVNCHCHWYWGLGWMGPLIDVGSEPVLSLINPYATPHLPAWQTHRLVFVGCKPLWNWLMKCMKCAVGWLYVRCALTSGQAPQSCNCCAGVYMVLGEVSALGYPKLLQSWTDCSTIPATSCHISPVSFNCAATTQYKHCSVFESTIQINKKELWFFSLWGISQHNSSFIPLNHKSSDFKENNDNWWQIHHWLVDSAFISP